MSSKKKRRKNKATHDPAYMIRRSDMRTHIDRLLRHDPVVQESLHEEAKRINRIESQQAGVDILTIILMSLHRSKEKMGRKRLLRFCYNFNDLQKYYEGRYADCDMFAMRKHLKEEVGIDVEHINDEIERFLNENPEERES